jgi:hypothetical protein
MDDRWIVNTFSLGSSTQLVFVGPCLCPPQGTRSLALVLEIVYKNGAFNRTQFHGFRCLHSGDFK